MAGASTDHREQASTRIQTAGKFVGQHRHRASQHDRVVRRVLAPAARGIPDLERYVVNVVAALNLAAACALNCGSISTL